MITSLLFLLLPSCIVVPKRELVNILFLFDIHYSNSIVQNDSNIDMDMNTPRSRSASSSFNDFRELLIHLNLSFILYYKRMKDIINKLSWNKQVALNEKENFTLSYASPKIGKNKLANKVTYHNPKDREQLSNINITILNNMPIS